MQRPSRLLCGLGVLLATGAPGAADSATPWRLQAAAGLPGWLTLSIQHRVRYESIAGQFRADGSGGDQGVALRTLAVAGVQRGAWRAGAELLDARLLLDDAGTPLDTGQVNAAELLQGYVGWTVDAPFGLAARSDLKLGRQTIDFGGRRLIARSAYRNAPNAFTGVQATLAGRGGREARVLAMLPIARRPDARTALAADVAGFDEEDSGAVLWATALSGAAPAVDAWLEGYVVGLHEGDSRFATRNRRLLTPGLRLWREPAPGRFDFELESMLQIGRVRATTAAADTVDLDHLAHYQHLQAGYSFAARGAPRLVAQFDYASGDADPYDGDSGRFDTLFGARRFEFGPTGLWGPFARSNLVTPGWRVLFQPGTGVLAGIGHRAYWLAQTRDAWTAAGVRDPSGRSGAFLGQQVEWQASWSLVPGNVTLEAGGAYLRAGRFAESAPDAAGSGTGGVLYTQLLLAF